MRTINYRKDINGLRGLAVLAILVFHLDLGLLPGGFVGVDIFFVISGYLISKIIYNEIRNDSFSLKTFYERRARRILPALVSTLIICSIVAYLRFFPGELIAYAKSMIAAVFFSANIYFYSSLNYFSPAATEIPLLHLWSLGIEEQFYIVFPLLMMLLARKVRFLTMALVIVTVLSLVFSQRILGTNPSAAFYLLPFRAFELLLGSLIAVGLAPRLTGKATFFISSIGFVFILYSLFLFNSKVTKFPGFSALLPCLGSALIIWAGEYKTTLPNRILSLRPLQWLGYISYSLYLVHWPIIVFAKRYYPYAEFFNYTVGVFALSLMLATLNFIFIEQPFRKPRQLSSPKLLMRSAMVMVLVALTGVTIIYHTRFPHTQDERLEKILAFLDYDHRAAFRDGTCFQDYDLAPDRVDISNCLPKGAHDKTVMLWGDSHAAHLYTGLKETLEAKGYSLGMLSASVCPPISGIEIPTRPHCKRFNEIALSTILKVKPKLLILAAYWPAEPQSLILLENTIKQLAKENIEIVILGNSPAYLMAVPKIIAEQVKKGKLIKSSEEMQYSGLLMHAELAMFGRFGKRKDLRYISILNNLCKDSCPLITADGVPVYFDHSHLTESGSRLFANTLTPLILGKA